MKEIRRFVFEVDAFQKMILKRKKLFLKRKHLEKSTEKIFKMTKVAEKTRFSS